MVTGGNTGIGYETAKALAEIGAKVIIAARDPERGAAAVEKLKADVDDANVSLQELDLADLASIQAAADQLSDSEERIDCLINNAGMGHAKGGETTDGFPIVMGTNHIGTFAFTEAMMPKLKKTAQDRGEVRVINLSSAAHQFARKLDPADLMPENKSMGRDAYCESKLCNLLHAREMARRYGMAGIRAHAVHPGFVNSEFSRSSHFPGAWQALFILTKPMQISPEKGAKTTLAAALSDDGAWQNGFYWDKEKIAQPTLPPDPEKLAKSVWAESVRLLVEKGFKLEQGKEEDAPPLTGPPSSLFPDGL
ncbi:MAG: SDR family NAD(P)-dependent oxidoreductase [Parvularculaceae bacterium]|nr:SDR family NAD(P)-dependent oxidoreductase [Parvularculaceae bacterium]